MPAATAPATVEAAGMKALDFIASVIHSLAWPAILLIIILLLRKQIVGLIPRVREVSILGTNAKFDHAAKEVQADLLATPATQAVAMDVLAQLPDPLPERIGRIVQTWNQFEQWLRANVSVDGLNPNPPVSQLINAGLQQGVLTAEQAQALRGLQVMRNLAVHGRGADIDEARMQEFLTLALALKFVLSIPEHA